MPHSLFIFGGLLSFFLAPARAGMARGCLQGKTGPAPRPEMVLQFGHRQPVNDLAFSPDGRTLASASDDGTVKLWNVATGDLQRTLAGHNREVEAIAFSPRGDLLASASWDGTVKIWDVRSGQPFRVLPDHWHGALAVAFSPDGRLLATGSYSGAVKLWNPATGRLQRALGAHRGPVISLEFSQDGMNLASGSGDPIDMAPPGELRLWDVRTGKPKWTRGPGGGPVAFSRDGRTLVNAHYGEIRFWVVRTGRLQSTREIRDHRVYTAIVSPDGTMLATSGESQGAGHAHSEVYLSDLRSGRQKQILKGGSGPMAYSPDGWLLATSDGAEPPHPQGGLCLWDPRTGALRRRWPAEPGYAITSVAFSPVGLLLATGSTDRKVAAWDLSAAEQRWTAAGDPRRVSSVAFSPDGRTLASGGYDHALKLWDAQTGRAQPSLESRRGGVTSVAYSTDGALLASGSYYDDLVLWNTRTRAPRALPGNPGGGAVAVAFSPDGERVAAGRHGVAAGYSNSQPGRDYSQLGIWELGSGQLRHTLTWTDVYVSSVAFSRDGRTLAAGGESLNAPPFPIGGPIMLWDVLDGAPRRTFTAHEGKVTSVAFSADGKTLASGSDDGTVRLWEMRAPDGALVLRRTLEGHSGKVLAVAFSPDGRLLASGGDGNAVQLWEAANGRLLARLLVLAPRGGQESAGDWILDTPAGYYRASPGAARVIRWRIGDRLLPAETYESTFHRPEVLQRALLGRQ
jgi:WD40 repeat protein